MLVVSRKQNQSVVFPALGISVAILRVAGKAVRVGIEAPSDIQILRGELVDQNRWEAGTCDSSDVTTKERHELRNRLNKANLAMKLLQKQLSAGMVADAEESLAIALESFQQMEQSVTVRGGKGANTTVDSGVAVGGAKRKRALLVEDDPNERVLLASYLRANGYEVDTAEDGQAALEYLVEHKPDAVLMDMELPRLNGSDCVKKIRRDKRFDDMKLFVVSGMEQTEMNVPTGDRGIQRWFQKPICPEDLVRELQTSLN